MAGKATTAQTDKALELGSFVRASGDRSIGRLASIAGDEAIVRYFRGPQESPYEDVRVAVADVSRHVPPVNTRVFFLRDRQWCVGRIDATPLGDEAEFVIALPNADGVVIGPDSFEVRWDRPIDDPFLFLRAGGTESPWLFDRRTALLVGAERQRTTARGAEGLLASSVEIHGHQFAAVRTAGSEERCRYLLADEVGMGKTIEACALIKQLRNANKPTLVVVPEHLVEQWQTELSQKFHLDETTHAITIVSSERPNEWPEHSPHMLVVDEAHHFTRGGRASDEARTLLAALASDASHLLLLSATPVRSNEAGFLDMLAMLDPVIYDPDDVEGFTQRVHERDRLARIARSLKTLDDKFAFEFLAAQLVELFPSDRSLFELIELAKECAEDGFERAVARVRLHLSSVYRLDHRVLRSRRGGLDGGAFAVRGRTRGSTFTLEVDDPTGAVRFELLEFVRTQLAVALDEARVSPKEAVEIFRELASRSSSLPVAAESAKAFNRLSPLLDENGLGELCSLRESLVSGGDRSIESLVAELSELAVARNAGRVVVASAFTEAMQAIAAAMQDKWGVHRFAVHSLHRSALENSDAIEHWETSPCSVLFIDSGAEEGINLQSADLLVHLDLPWSTNRIEQRIGRCDRFDGDRRAAIESSVVAYGDCDYAAAWFGFQADSAEVFDRSVSALQYSLAAAEERLILDVIESGPTALFDSIDALREELRQDEVTIAAHDALDSADATIDVKALVDADSDERFSDALTDWLSGIGCRSHQVRPGVISYRSKGRPQVPQSLELKLNKYSDTPLALSRQASVRTGYELLRVGHPLVDSIVAHLRKSDRGVAFTMQRHATATWPPVPVLRAEVVVSIDQSMLASIAKGEAFVLLRNLCAELMPPRHESVYFLPDGREADHPSITRPYDKAKGDLNLGSRTDVRAELEALVDWADLCVAGRTHTERIVRARLSDQGEHVKAIDQVIERFAQGLDQRRLRSEQSDIGPGEQDSVDLAVLSSVLRQPRTDVIGAGAIFLCDLSARPVDV